jgi:hypothetical protein
VAGLIGKTSGAREDSQARIDRPVARLRTVSAPLLQLIDFKELTVADPGGPATP